jgi:hypothetical protein
MDGIGRLSILDTGLRGTVAAQDDTEYGQAYAK